MQKIDLQSRQSLYSVAATRQIEQAAQAQLPPHTLMQRAGLAVAQLALALAPHARRVWVACGPGNNGGDGLEAAMHLQHWGKQPVVTWLGTPPHAPPDAAASYQRAIDAGITFVESPPPDFDLGIDALLGIGSALRSPQARMADWIRHLNQSAAPVLAVDLPSGLHADTGAGFEPGVKADYTLCLLTLKPGLFTAQGRDAVGTVWLADLECPSLIGAASGPVAPAARLGAAPLPLKRLHASHKGSYGDVAVVGGAAGMTGAALLAASGALHAGAGRVYVGLLDGGSLRVDTQQPELMFRAIDQLGLASMTVVCGCGGANAVRAVLPKILSCAARLVLDADALNAIADDASLQTLLRQRGARTKATVLTPHPLEAARLLGTSVGEVQNDRLTAALQLSARFDCCVVLKGSGSIITGPGQVPVINPTGNARLATAGTGDVLAGVLGARLAAGLSAFDAACHAVYRHGQAADQWPCAQTLTAGALLRSL